MHLKPLTNTYSVSSLHLRSKVRNGPLGFLVFLISLFYELLFVSSLNSCSFYRHDRFVYVLLCLRWKLISGKIMFLVDPPQNFESIKYSPS
jgi:hypothetical protein